MNTTTIETYCEALRRRLMSPPLEPIRVLVLYQADRHSVMEMVVLDADHSLLFATRLYPEHSERQRIEAIEAIRRTLHHFNLHAIVVPAGRNGKHLLGFLGRFKLPSDVQTLQTDLAGSMARADADPDDATPAGLSRDSRIAISLGRATQDPFRELSSVDPVRLLEQAPALSSGEHEHLRERLLATREACRQAVEQQGDGEGCDPRGQTAHFRFSETIASLDDLKPGMQLPGIVTHVTEFGAFVNVGIAQEGLVHISELTGKFVTAPSEVVRPGQVVQVRVLSVDAIKKRLALSMRKESETGKPRNPPGAPPRAKPGKATPAPRPAKPPFKAHVLGDAFDALGL